MKAIKQKLNQEEGWRLMGSAYCGLSKETAEEEIKTLRRNAAEDDSGYKYKIIDCELVPK